MNELERLCKLLDAEGIRYVREGNERVLFYLNNVECFARVSVEGKDPLFAGVGLRLFDCGHMKSAEHALTWCKWALGLITHSEVIYP